MNVIAKFLLITAMTKTIVKLTGTPSNYMDNLLYFFQTLKFSHYIEHNSQCVFLIEKSVSETVPNLLEFLNQQNIQIEIFSSISFLQEMKLNKRMSQNKVTLLYIPYELEQLPLPKSYVHILKKLANLIIITGTNHNAEIFSPIHTWSTIFLNGELI